LIHFQTGKAKFFERLKLVSTNKINKIAKLV